MNSFELNTLTAVYHPCVFYSNSFIVSTVDGLVPEEVFLGPMFVLKNDFLIIDSFSLFVSYS